MKKIFALAALALLLGVAAVAEARIMRDEMALGGIVLTNTRAEVEAIYGGGSYRDIRTASGEGLACDYGNGLTIFYGEQSPDSTVMSIKVTERNGWTTPAGVEVGMDASVLKSIYGEPDDAHSQDGATVYSYGWLPGTEWRLNMLRFLVKDDKITQIALVNGAD